MSLLRSFSPQGARVAQVTASEQPQYVPVVKKINPTPLPLRSGGGLYQKTIKKLSELEKTKKYKDQAKIREKIERAARRAVDRARIVARKEMFEARKREAARVKSLEQKEARRIAVELRKQHARGYVEHMRRIRTGKYLRKTKKSDFYPNQKKMILFLENDKVLSLVSSRGGTTKQYLFSKKDLLEAKLLVELNEWILWPIVSGRYPVNEGFKKVEKENEDLEMEQHVFHGYDLKVVSRILSCLIGGITQMVQKGSGRRQELFYFPFYTTVFTGSAVRKQIIPDSEQNREFEKQRTDLNVKTQTGYMQWTLSPYDYGAQGYSERETSFSSKLWKKFGAKNLLKTFQDILIEGSKDDPLASLFPGKISLKEYGIQDEIRTAWLHFYGEVGFKYKWPGFKTVEGKLQDSPLLYRLKYLVEKWETQKKLWKNDIQLKKKKKKEKKKKNKKKR